MEFVPRAVLTSAGIGQLGEMMLVIRLSPLEGAVRVLNWCVESVRAACLQTKLKFRQGRGQVILH